MLLPLIFTAQVGGAAISETGSQILPFKPFWASRTFVARHAARTRRFVTTDAYVEQIMGSTRAALEQQLDMRQMPRVKDESDDKLRLRLLAFLADLELPEDPLSVMGIGELRAIAAERGLDSQARAEDLRKALKVEAPYAVAGEPIAINASKAKRDDKPAPDAEPAQAAEGAPKDLPVTTDAPQADVPALDEDELVAELTPAERKALVTELQRAVAADDYKATFDALSGLTDERPASRKKSDVMAFGAALLASLT